jgi:hypothetical protein
LALSAHADASGKQLRSTRKMDDYRLIFDTNNIFDTKLSTGKRLGDATKEDLEAEAAYHQQKADGSGSRRAAQDALRCKP